MPGQQNDARDEKETLVVIFSAEKARRKPGGPSALPGTPPPEMGGTVLPSDLPLDRERRA
jgi:hypothetical protein